MRTATLTVLAVLLLAAQASAAPIQLGRTILTGGDPAHRAQYQAWIDAGTAPQAAVYVRLLEADCPETEEPGVPCVSTDDGRRWRLYMPPYLLEPQNVEGRFAELDLLHEVGHIYDFSYTRDRHRTRFMRVFGYEGWLDPLNTTWEKWAMAYAYCSAGLPWAQYRRELPADGAFASKHSTEHGGFWGYGYDVGKRDYRAACRVVGTRPSGGSS